MPEAEIIAANGLRRGIRERLAPMLASPAERRGLWILGGGVVVAGMALNWSWLAAVGIAPLLVAAAPCLAMCALGLCAMDRNSSCKTTDSAPKAAIANTASKSTRVVAADTDEDEQADRKEVETRPAALRAIETVASAEPAVSTETEVQPTKERNLTHA